MQHKDYADDAMRFIKRHPTFQHMRGMGPRMMKGLANGSVLPGVIKLPEEEERRGP
jgi:hypothetical protein